MDEYVALPQDHAESYHTFMHENLFRHIDILPENAHILDGRVLLFIGLKTT
jgi:glucosamine-6-phosphate deaminase